MFSRKILTEEKSATETVGTGTQEGRHNDHFGLISDIYRNHEMIVSIQCVSFCLYFPFLFLFFNTVVSAEPLVPQRSVPKDQKPNSKYFKNFV